MEIFQILMIFKITLTCLFFKYTNIMYMKITNINNNDTLSPIMYLIIKYIIIKMKNTEEFSDITKYIFRLYLFSEKMIIDCSCSLEQ
jgi:hypothetical protein